MLIIASGQSKPDKKKYELNFLSTQNILISFKLQVFLCLFAFRRNKLAMRDSLANLPQRSHKQRKYWRASLLV